jgi:hypothetical protein
VVTCPLCGWQMRKGDILPGGFRCPGCKERLRSGFRPRLVGLGSIVVAFLVPYLAGARGITLVEYGIALFFPICYGYAALRGFFFPRLVKDTRKEEDGFPHIIGPPDSSDKT